jgi:hypothetical protein
MNNSFYAAGRSREPAAVVDIAAPSYSIVRFVGYNRHSITVGDKEYKLFLTGRKRPKTVK